MFIDLIKDSSVPISIFIFILLVISFFWSRVLIYFNFNKYDSLHMIHENEIPKAGGILIILFIILLLTYHNKFDNYFLSLFLSSIPIIIIGVKEDLFNNTSPSQRLLSMFLSTSIFFVLLPINFPTIEIPFLSILFQNYYFQFIFFSFSTLVIINGMNLIDGTNGLMTSSALMQLCSVMFLSYTFNDIEIFHITTILLLPLSLFLIFNYPFGKIFMGDLGAYFYGLSIALLVIYFFSRHSELLSWVAVLIFFHPAVELLASFVRKKFFENKSPMSPDLRHIHTLLYFFIKKYFKNNRLSNNFVLLIMAPFWLFPFLCVFTFYDSLILILTSILFLTILYLAIYLLLIFKKTT